MATTPRDELLAERATRAAWLYYDRGLTQDEIARRLIVSRSTVSRLLTYAREAGIVAISLTRPLPEVAALETALHEAFPLRVIAVEPLEPGEAPAEAVARGGARLLARLARNPSTIGVGWGSTLAAAARALPRAPAPWVRLVDVVGRPPGDGSRLVAVSQLLARLWSVETISVPAPAFADSVELRERLLRDPVVREVLGRARSADMIVVSIGSVSADATFVRQGVLTDADMRRLHVVGAVGDLLGHFYDADGREVAVDGVLGPVGLDLDDLRGHHSVVALAGGETKLAGIRSAASHGLISGLVTDESTARSLLEC
jgi:DNA-binding transcriptional regulator LsrR (DeoR family)